MALVWTQAGVDFLTRLVIRLIRRRTMSSQPVTMSHPPSIFLHSGRKKCQKFPTLPHPSTQKSQKKLCIISPVSCTVPCTCTCIMAAWLSDPWILPDLDILCKHHPLWNTAAQFSDPHRRLATSSVNINMCPQSTLLHGTAFYLTYFTTNYFSNDLGNGSFKDLRGVIVSSKHGVLTLQTVHITHAMNCPMH